MSRLNNWFMRVEKHEDGFIYYGTDGLLFLGFGVDPGFGRIKNGAGNLNGSGDGKGVDESIFDEFFGKDR